MKTTAPTVTIKTLQRWTGMLRVHCTNPAIPVNNKTFLIHSCFRHVVPPKTNEWFPFESYFDKRLYGKVECNIYVKEEIIAQIYHASNWTECLISDQIFKNTVPVLACRERQRLCQSCSRNRWKNYHKKFDSCHRVIVVVCLFLGSVETAQQNLPLSVLTTYFWCFLGSKMWVNLH